MIINIKKNANMKKQLFLAISLCASCLCGAQSLNPYYYYFKGEKQYLELNPDYALVGKSNQLTRSVQAEVEKVDLKNVSAAAYSAKIDLLKNKEGVNFVTPYFTSKNGNTFSISDLFIVQLKKAEDAEMLKNYAKSKGIQVINQNEYAPLWYALSCEGTSMNAMESANMFYESGLFASAGPDFISIRGEAANSSTPQGSNKAARIVGGPVATTIPINYSDQWGLNNTGQYSGVAGLDINILNQSWGTTAFKMVPKVAVVDDGVDMNHPALKLAYSFDMKDVVSPNKVYASQGTAVAGVIAAKPVNGINLRGVFPACELMSISHPYGGDVSTYGFANAIIKAYKEGADVINCSWGDSEQEGSDFLEYAVNTAATKGRNGLGCVLVFAAGNANNGSIVNYPARKDNVIGVGAIVSNGSRRAPSYGGDWGSNYGTGLDLVAPGEWIATTDRMGSYGYNPSNIVNDYTNLNYHKYFAGTASACPFVSGVAAIVLSANPTLTAVQVKQILMAKATKLTKYSYPLDKTNTFAGGLPTANLQVKWNPEVGSGLVNAYAAKLEADKYLPKIVEVSGTSTVLQYRVDNLLNNPSLKVRWSISKPNEYYIAEESGAQGVTLFPNSSATTAVLYAEVYTGGDQGVPVKVLFKLSKTIWMTAVAPPVIVVHDPVSPTLKIVQNGENAEMMATRTTVSPVTVNLYSNATLVRSEKALSTDREISMDISGLSTGNYVLNVISNGKIIHSQTILIKR